MDMNSRWLIVRIDQNARQFWETKRPNSKSWNYDASAQASIIWIIFPSTLNRDHVCETVSYTVENAIKYGKYSSTFYECTSEKSSNDYTSSNKHHPNYNTISTISGWISLQNMFQRALV